ncbi:MAG: hypothetical protein EON88_06440 [Brevundimonas sp.]|nr:MAG: hypothetical protein EON88_06440 [Brevundimonas sp.]
MKSALFVALSVPLLASCVTLDPAPLPSPPPAEAQECAIFAAALKAYAVKKPGQEVFSTALPLDWIDRRTPLPTTEKTEFRDLAACVEIMALAGSGEIRLRPIFEPVEIIDLSGHRYVSMPAGTFVSRPFVKPSGSTEVLVEPSCAPIWRISMTFTGSQWIGSAAEDEDSIVMCHARARRR